MDSDVDLCEDDHHAPAQPMIRGQSGSCVRMQQGPRRLLLSEELGIPIASYSGSSRHQIIHRWSQAAGRARRASIFRSWVSAQARADPRPDEKHGSTMGGHVAKLDEKQAGASGRDDSGNSSDSQGALPRHHQGLWLPGTTLVGDFMSRSPAMASAVVPAASCQAFDAAAGQPGTATGNHFPPATSPWVQGEARIDPLLEVTSTEFGPVRPLLLHPYSPAPAEPRTSDAYTPLPQLPLQPQADGLPRQPPRPPPGFEQGKLPLHLLAPQHLLASLQQRTTPPLPGWHPGLEQRPPATACVADAPAEPSAGQPSEQSQFMPSSTPEEITLLLPPPEQQSLPPPPQQLLPLPPYQQLPPPPQQQNQHPPLTPWQQQQHQQQQHQQQPWWHPGGVHPDLQQQPFTPYGPPWMMLPPQLPLPYPPHPHQQSEQERQPELGPMPHLTPEAFHLLHMMHAFPTPPMSGASPPPGAPGMPAPRPSGLPPWPPFAASGLQPHVSTFGHPGAEPFSVLQGGATAPVTPEQMLTPPAGVPCQQPDDSAQLQLLPQAEAEAEEQQQQPSHPDQESPEGHQPPPQQHETELGQSGMHLQKQRPPPDQHPGQQYDEKQARSQEQPPPPPVPLHPPGMPPLPSLSLVQVAQRAHEGRPQVPHLQPTTEPAPPLPPAPSPLPRSHYPDDGMSEQAAAEDQSQFALPERPTQPTGQEPQGDVKPEAPSGLAVIVAQAEPAPAPAAGAQPEQLRTASNGAPLLGGDRMAAPGPPPTAAPGPLRPRGARPAQQAPGSARTILVSKTKLGPSQEPQYQLHQPLPSQRPPQQPPHCPLQQPPLQQQQQHQRPPQLEEFPPLRSERPASGGPRAGTLAGNRPPPAPAPAPVVPAPPAGVAAAQHRPAAGLAALQASACATQTGGSGVGSGAAEMAISSMEEVRHPVNGGGLYGGPPAVTLAGRPPSGRASGGGGRQSPANDAPSRQQGAGGPFPVAASVPSNGPGGAGPDGKGSASGPAAKKKKKHWRDRGKSREAPPDTSPAEPESGSVSVSRASCVSGSTRGGGVGQAARSGKGPMA